MKLLAALLIAVPALYVTVGEADTALQTLAPAAATAVSDINLRAINTQLFTLVHLDGLTQEEALSVVAEGFSQEGITYTSDNGTLKVETEWSCRRLIFNNVAAKTVDC